ncbi:MAG: LPS-assembly protein LptD, partial [Candidatus Anammoxibacter sp.]
FQSDVAIIDVYFDGNVSMLDGGKAERHEQLFLRLETSAGIVVETGKDGVNGFEEEQETNLLIRAKSVKQKAKSGLADTEQSAETQIFSVPSSSQVITVLADEVDSWVEGDKRIVTAIGNVKIKKENFVLDADNVVLYFDREEGEGFKFQENDFDELYAEGNVTLRRKDDVQIAEKIFVDTKKNKGLLVNAQIQVRADIVKSLDTDRTKAHKYGEMELETKEEAMVAYIKAEEIKLVGEGQYEIKNGEFTTCSFDHPHFKFKSSKIRIIKTGDQSVISLAGNRVYMGNRTVFYWPYLSFDLRSKPSVLQDWAIGNSSRFGTMVSTDWNLFNLGFAENIDKWSDLYLSLDFLQKRGPAAGLKYDYNLPNVFGSLDTFYINDKKDEELNGEEVEGEDRWRLSWRHRQFLPYNVRLDIEANNLSDDGFLRNFYEKIFKEEKDEETVLYLRRLKDTEGITFLLKKQLNSFDTFVDARKMDRVAERLPELSYRIIGEPLWSNRLNFTSESSLTYFDRVFNNNPGERVPASTIRFDTNHELSSPFQISAVKVRPYIGGRAIGYTDSVEGKNRLGIRRRPDDDGSAKVRLVGTVGLDMSATFWRTYSYYNEFLDINRLRHVFTPEIRYSFNPFITKNPEEMNQFDSVDRLDDSQWLLLGFRNKLQTKRRISGVERVVDLVYFDVELNLFLGNAGNDSVFNNEIVFNSRRENFIQFDFRAQLNDKISFVSERNEFNIAKGTMDVINVGISLDYDPKWRAFLGQRFIEGVSSSVLFSTNYRFDEKWAIGFFEQFDFRSGFSEEDEDLDRDLGRNLRTSFVLTRYFHDWIGSFTTEFNPVRDETITRFDIFPRALNKEKKSNRFWF